MTYGFELYNSNGVLLANDTDFNYGLVTQGSLTTNMDGNLVNVTFNDTVEKPLVFIRINSFQWIELAQISTTSVGFRGYEEIASGFNGRRRPFSVQFQYKIFAPFKHLGTPSGQNQNNGLVVYDSTGVNKTFDSRYEIPLIAGSTVITLPTPTNITPAPINSYTIPAGINESPWINLTALAGDGSAYGIHYPSVYENQRALLFRCVRCQAGSLQISYGAPFTIGLGSGSTYASGQGTTKTIFFMNPVTGPLQGSVVFLAASSSSSCNYTTPAQTSCSTSVEYRAEYLGGNTNTVFYLWELINNTGGLTLTATYPSDNTATVSKTGAAGTYTATLRCTIFQSGSTDVVIDTSVSLVHSVVQGLDGTIAFSSGSTSCSYDSGATSNCATSANYTATPSGGNGNTISYSWQLLNASAGFTIAGGTQFSQTVTVTGLSSAATLTGTLRCTISQLGSTDKIVDLAVSSTHTISTAPVARFTATPLTASANETVVQFDGTSSSNAATYQWDFNNFSGYVSTVSQPTRIYVDPGQYSVKLRITNSAGTENILIKTNYINVIYNEKVKISAYTSESYSIPNYTYNVPVLTNFQILITGGVPNTTVTVTGAVSRTDTLDANGTFTYGGDNSLPAGTYIFNMSFAGSGNTRVLTIISGAATVPNPLAFNGNTYQTYEGVDGTATLSLELSRNGNWDIYSGNADIGVNGTWVSPTSATVGDTYWVKFTRNSFTGVTYGTATATTGWLQLNVARGILISVSSSTTIARTVTTSYTIEISSDSAGSAILSTTNVTLWATAATSGTGM